MSGQHDGRWGDGADQWRGHTIMGRRNTGHRLGGVMRLTILLLALGLLALPGIASAAESVLDQSASGSDPAESYVQFSGHHARAQTFTVGITGDLDRVRVMIATGRDGDVGDLTAEIRELDAAGQPAGEVLGIGTVPPPAQRDVFAWVEIALEAPVPVTRGTQYALVLRAPTTISGWYEWYVEMSAPYAGGNLWLYWETTEGSWLGASTPQDTWFQTFVVPSDVTAPAVTVPADITAEATGPSGAVVAYSASGTDAVDGTVTASCSPSSGGTFAPGVTTVTCSATDAAGNTGSASFTVEVQDSTAPTLSGMPSNMTLEATGPSGAAATYAAPTARDRVSGSAAVSCSPASGSTFPLGINTVTCSATDAAGNTGKASFTVTVRDTSPPGLNGLPSDMTLEATGPSGTVATYTRPTASDTVDGAVTPKCSPASGSTFGLGTTTVTCSATDKAGNTSSRSFTVTVRDTTSPAVTVPGNITAEATGPSGAVVSYTASANDTMDGAITPSCKPASGNTFALGATTITCEASDEAGNTGSGSFTIAVRDTTKPVLGGMPSDIALEATGAAGAKASWDAPTASDTVDGTITPTCSPVSGSTFGLGKSTVTCSAKDDAGNSASSSFTITVGDTTKPVVRVPADITVNATGPAGTIVSYSASASDAVDGAINPTCSPASGTTFAQGTTAVTCEATDNADNTGSASFTVTVKGASTQVTDQETLVRGMTGISAGTKASLTDKLGGIGESVESGEIKAACNQLDAYINQIKALQGKKQIAKGDATQLIGNANRIKSVLGC